MKKYLKIIGVNLIILFIILLFLETVCHFIYYKNYVHQKFNIKYFKSKMVDMSWFNPDESVYKEKNNTKKRPISTIGCSFVAGVEERDKTFASELNRRTNRKTYNRGQSATGSTMMFYQLQHEDLKKGNS